MPDERARRPARRDPAPNGGLGDAADPTTALDAATAREALGARGLRYSRAREAILGYMGAGGRHESAESLHQALRERGVDLSLSTVYLNLGVLVGAGLLREFVGARGEALYDGNVDPHYHLVCSETGVVVDVPAPTVDGRPLGAFLKAYVEDVTGWTVSEAHLTLRGRPPNRRPEGGDAPRTKPSARRRTTTR